MIESGNTYLRQPITYSFKKNKRKMVHLILIHVYNYMTAGMGNIIIASGQTLFIIYQYIIAIYTRRNRRLDEVRRL